MTTEPNTRRSVRPMKTAYVVALGAVALVGIVVRAIQAATGTLTAAQAGGEAGIVCAGVGLAIAVAVGTIGARPRVWALFGLILFAAGAGVFVPLWRIAHPPEVLATEVLGGARREASFVGPARAGVYHLEVSATPRAQGGPPEVGGTYVLHVRRQDPAERIEGALGATSSLFEISLLARQRVDLFLERSDASLTVTLREPPPSMLGLRIAGLVALLLAIVADLVAIPVRRRGLLSLVVAVPGLYAFLLGLTPAPGAGDVLGAAVIGLFGGALFVVIVVGGLSALLARRSPTERRRRSARARTGTAA